MNTKTEQYYRKVFIKTEDDLPKEYGFYWTHSVGMGVRKISFDKANRLKWLVLYDWYFLPLPKSGDEDIRKWPMEA